MCLLTFCCLGSVLASVLEGFNFNKILGPPGASLGAFWCHVGVIRHSFGPSWDPLGPSWDPFRPSLVYLEGLLGVSWHSLGVFWSPEWSCWEKFGDIMCIFEAF